jgi:aspartate carbamoyltransferase regulatory subunit
MIITNKITGRNISKEYLGLMNGIITNDEFEMITLISPRLTINKNLTIK